jgi:short-subunit dehydrogenase
MSVNERQKRAFITGASRGIGKAIAQSIAPMCSHLFVAAKSEGSATTAAKAIRDEAGCEVHHMWGDLVNGRAFGNRARDLVASVTDHLDVLVLNAGYYVEGTLSSIADEDFERNMLVNCHSAHYVVSSLLPLIRQSASGRIVIIGSTAGYEPYPLVPTYGIAKWGLRGYALNLRKELMSDNIGVTFISPGGTLTDMWAGSDIEPGRLLEPSDIGKLVAATLSLSGQAVVEELIVRPMLGDIHE